MRAALVLVGLMVAGPVCAETIGWATWLRAGPGTGAAVLDEVQAGERVEVRGCAAGWCRVVTGRKEGRRAEGYVAAGMVGAEGARGLVRAEGACAAGPRVTPEGMIGMTLCPAR